VNVMHMVETSTPGDCVGVDLSKVLFIRNAVDHRAETYNSVVELIMQHNVRILVRGRVSAESYPGFGQCTIFIANRSGEFTSYDLAV